MISIENRTSIMNHDGVCTQIVGDGITAAEALEGAGLNWKVGLVDAGFRVRGGVFTASKVGRKACVKLDADGKPETDFGYVGKSYQPIQNVEMFDWADTLVEGAGAHYEAAWSMRGGEEIGLTLRFPEHVQVAGEDTYAKYLLLRGRHTGAGSVLAAVTMVNLYCTNQLDLAVRSAQRVVRVAHLKNASAKFVAARSALEIGNRYETEFVGMMNELAGERISDERFDDVVRGVLSDAHFGGLDAKVAAVRELRKTGAIREDLRGTKYGALMAATEWLDWAHTARTPQSKVHDMLDGRIHSAKDALVQELIAA